jgi:hypothetical protein
MLSIRAVSTGVTAALAVTVTGSVAARPFNTTSASTLREAFTATPGRTDFFKPAGPD